MNLREVASISTAALFGAAVSAIAVRFFFVSPSNTTSRKHFSSVDEKIGPQCPFDPSKRKGYLSWDDYFMAIAFLSAERSKDPNRQVGACLVSQSGIILGIGYNGFPRGCSDDSLPWSKVGGSLKFESSNFLIVCDLTNDIHPLAIQKSKTGNPLETKYPYVCHAEVNAILNTNHASAAGQRLYVTMFPCNECAKIIIQQMSSVVRFVYFDFLCNSSLFVKVFSIYDWLPYQCFFLCNQQSGVSEVIYFVEKRLKNSDTAYVASHKLLTLAGVKVNGAFKGILQRRSVEVISAENWIIQERVSGWL
ncbi:hypothetical protein C3L33_14456, partial [Rhododendron williamsianum]